MSILRPPRRWYVVHPWLTELTWLIVSHGCWRSGLFLLLFLVQVLACGNDRETAAYQAPMLPRAPHKPSTIKFSLFLYLFSSLTATLICSEDFPGMYSLNSLKAPVILHCPRARLKICSDCSRVLFFVMCIHVRVRAFA